MSTRPPDLEDGYFGPAAQGFADGRLPSRADILDLFEPALWRNARKSNAYDLRGPAFCALFVCTGANLGEAVRMRCGQWLPLGRRAVDLGGNNVNLKPRTVPLVSIAHDVIARYDSAVQRASGCDAFFVDNRGKGTTLVNVQEQFRCMAQRVGLDGRALPARLRGLFLSYLEDWPDKVARFTLAGWHERHRISEDERTPSPNFAEKLAILERVLPIGRADREMLKWRGAVERAFPDPHFPELSAEARYVLDEIRAGRTKCHPAEVRAAVREAIASGKRQAEVCEHYGLGKQAVGAWKNGIEPSEHLCLSRKELKALKDYGASTDRPTATGLAEALGKAGRPMILQSAREWARKHGLVLIDGRCNPLPESAVTAVLGYGRSTDRPTARGVQAALANSGCRVMLRHASYWGRKNGLLLVSECNPNKPLRAFRGCEREKLAGARAT
jgi:hypothetical protein